MASIRPLVLGCLLVALARPAVAQSVIVLDAAGGGDATTLQAALDMAVDGDLVLVRPGDYALLAEDSELTGKGLDIVGDGPGVQLGALTIRDVPDGSLVRLRSVTLGPVAIQVSLTVRDCAGPVLVEGCQLVASQASAPVFSPSPPGPPRWSWTPAKP